MTDAVQYSHEKIRSRFADPIFILLLILPLRPRRHLNLTGRVDVSPAIGDIALACSKPVAIP